MIFPKIVKLTDTMNLLAISSFFLFFVGFLWCSRVDLAVNQPTFDDSVILGKIISNFLKKYFSNNKIFVSIIFSADGKEQNRFWNDFTSNLVGIAASTGFAYNVLDKLDNATRDNMNQFNLFIVRNSTVLQ